MTFETEHGLDPQDQYQAVVHSSAVGLTRSTVDSTESKFESLFQNVPDALVIVDNEGRLVYINQAACELASIEAIHPASCHIEKVFALQEDWGSVSSTLKREGEYRGHGWIRQHNGTRRLVEIRLSADVADGNHLAVFREISNPYITECESVLSEKQQSVVSVATGVAHELVNLLNVIGGHTELLLATMGTDDAAKSHGQSILAATKHAGMLVSQLAAFGRQQLLSPSMVDLAAFVRSLRSSTRSLVPEDIDLIFADSTESVCVCVDRTQLCQIIWTLASRMGGGLSKGGSLTYVVKQLELKSACQGVNCVIPRGHYAVLELRGKLKRRNGAADSLSGIGEGESVDGFRIPAVSSTIRQNRGFIAVDRNSSEIIWSVYFPRTTGRELATHNEESPVPGGAETILLVEDDPALREVTREYLKSLGYNVFRASNGEEALETAGSLERIDLLITDVRMPKMGGDELAEVMIRQRPGIRILFLSGHIQCESSQHLTERRNALFKPFTLRSLAITIRDLLNGREP